MSLLHLALPLRVGDDGALAAVVQDSPGEVAQSVAVLLATRVGERRSVPLYGSTETLGQLVGTPSVDYAAIALWEDRADPTTVTAATFATTQGTTLDDGSS